MMEEYNFGRRTIRAYMAAPETGSGKGGVVCQAWWGLTEVFADACNHLAAEGFVAIATG